MTLSKVLSSHLNHLHPHPHCWDTLQQEKHCTFTSSPCVQTVLLSLSIFFFSTFFLSTFLKHTFPQNFNIILSFTYNGSPNFGRKEKCRNVIMSKSNNVENKNGTSVKMLDAFKRQHMIVRNFNALTLSRTFSPSLLFLFSTFSFFGIFMFRHFYFRPKLGLPIQPSIDHLLIIKKSITGVS